jgi:hypothetical protein
LLTHAQNCHWYLATADTWALVSAVTDTADLQTAVLMQGKKYFYTRKCFAWINPFSAATSYLQKIQLSDIVLVNFEPAYLLLFFVLIFDNIIEETLVFCFNELHLPFDNTRNVREM